MSELDLPDSSDSLHIHAEMFDGIFVDYQSDTYELRVTGDSLELTVKDEQ